MKRYNRITRVLVDFDPNGGVKPAYFICSTGKRARVLRVLQKDEARWGFQVIYSFRA